VQQTPDAWPAWLRAAGVADLSPRQAVTYDHLSIALSAAEEGRGVALCGRFLCERRLESKRLCLPFERGVKSALTYHLVCRPEGLETRASWRCATGSSTRSHNAGARLHTTQSRVQRNRLR
jgi:DNA-binding transcriptional LysR family regulator